ncbi:hypothetical protein ZOD2009_09630 [Haladaptatus paucihalophilus DX253]|nr:hypothetical protein ZOD2009_09630 [Haladaptatus paucihalophilus DX253]
MLTNQAPIQSGNEIHINVPKNARQMANNQSVDDDGGSNGSDFPVTILGLSFLSIVIGGILLYRVL